MIRYFGMRLAILLPKLIIITIIIFVGLKLVPGDPITRTISPEIYATLSTDQLEDLRTKLGLNDNPILQYIKWISGIVKGDFGYSLTTGGSISEMMAQRLPPTFALAFTGLLFANLFGLILGFISAIKKDSILDYVIITIGLIGLSVPEFFFGLWAILIFAINLGWFPTGGVMEYGKEGLFDKIQYLILPSFILGISLIATLMRYTRDSLLDVLNKDYIKVARSKGLSEFEVNFKHGFRNALIPIMVIIVMRIPFLVGGTVIIESVFNYPGVGSLLLSAVSSKDMPVVMIATMLIAFAILLSSFLVDIFSAMLDPRIKFGAGGGT